MVGKDAPSRLAEKGHGRITNAEVRGHLTRLGHKGTSAYVGNLLYKLTQEGLLLKSGYGEYTIAHDNPRLRALRFREHREELIAEMRAEREGKGGRQPPPETEVMRAEPGSSAALFTPANPRIVQKM